MQIVAVAIRATTPQLQHNKALHPTTYSPLVPRSLSAAGELGRCVAARGTHIGDTQK